MTPYALLSAKEVIELKEDEVSDASIAKRNRRKQKVIDDRLSNYILPRNRPMNPWNKTPELRIVLVGNVI